jgi:hypothetical protein
MPIVWIITGVQDRSLNNINNSSIDSFISPQLDLIYDQQTWFCIIHCIKFPYTRRSAILSEIQIEKVELQTWDQ